MVKEFTVWKMVIVGRHSVSLVKVTAIDLFGHGDPALVRYRGMVLRRDIAGLVGRHGLGVCKWAEYEALCQQVRAENVKDETNAPLGFVFTEPGNISVDVHGEGVWDNDSSPDALWSARMPLIFVQSRKPLATAVPTAA